MKKIFSAAIFIVSAAIFCGCAHKTEKADNGNASGVSETQTGNSQTPDTVENITSESVVPENPVSVSGQYIKDYAGIMDSEAAAACNQVISELNSSRMINAAVVTVNKLDGAEPYDYASRCYNQIFGSDSSRGLLFLINNDTNEDILYKAGGINIDPEAEKNAFYQATRDIVGKDYSSAAIRMLRLGEECSSHIFDQAGFFNSQQISELEKAAAGYGKDVSVYTVGNTAETSRETAESLCRRRYPAKDGVMLLIDGNGRTMAYSETDIPAELQISAPDRHIAGGGELYTYLLELLNGKRGT